uniref:H15 domain-containing protein n=1 Tax=Amblyomma maculatum TaxID=34609 RepID=G3MS01_AMBMU
MESDSSEESLASADRKLAPTKKAPKMAIMIEDAVSNCSDRKGATPAYIRNYILGKYPELDRTRFKTTFKKAFLTAIEKKALLRTKATETALGLSGRVKLAPKVKPSRKAPTPPESQGSSNAGPSSKASPKKTKKSGAASTVDRTKGAEAKKPAEGQRKRGAGAKEPVADTTKDSSTSGKKTPSSSVAPAKGVKDTKVPVSKAPKGRGAAVKRGKANLEEMKATEKEEVPVEKRKNTVSDDEYAFVDVEQSGDNQSSPSSFRPLTKAMRTSQITNKCVKRGGELSWGKKVTTLLNFRQMRAMLWSSKAQTVARLRRASMVKDLSLKAKTRPAKLLRTQSATL